MEHCTPINSCLACGSTDLVLTLDLRTQPLANSFQEHIGVREEDLWFPLAINRCEDCNHLQLTHAVNPALIYTHYLYVSGTSGTYLEYMKWYAKFVREQFPYWPKTVLDIGCNDGSQLNAFKDLGFLTFGVDPAKNLYPKSSANHNVVCGFWDNETASQLGTKFDVITIQNAFAHNPNPLKFLQLCKEQLTHDGKIFISTSQADMVLNGEFDTIYHEHISYYNAESMRRLAERAGLFLIDVIKTPIHGTSYIFVLSKQRLNTYRLENILASEEAAGLHNELTYTNWATDVSTLLSSLYQDISDYKELGYTIVGYGAAAKGMTLINASDIDSLIDCVIDDNPLKQGLYCPGTAVPVVNIDWLDRLNVSDRVLFIPLAWNFYAEIKKKILAKRTSGNDVFMKYFPVVKTEK